MAVDLPRGHSGGGGYWNKKMGEGGALNRHRLDFRKERDKQRYRVFRIGHYTYGIVHTRRYTHIIIIISRGEFTYFHPSHPVPYFEHLSLYIQKYLGQSAAAYDIHGACMQEVGGSLYALFFIRPMCTYCTWILKLSLENSFSRDNEPLVPWSPPAPVAPSAVFA